MAGGVDVFDIQVGSERLVVVAMPSCGSAVEVGKTLDALTSAEREVARAVLRGLSNEEVALDRGCRPRTVAVQLGSIYRKLGVASRSELAALVARADLAPGESD